MQFCPEVQRFEIMFFDNWFGLFRTLIIGVLAYSTLVVLLRISGKRTLSKMNAFDLVVTVALGSTLATILLSKDVALAEGIVAFAVLITLQFVIAWLSVRSSWIESLVKSEPSLLLYQGQFLRSTMQSERVTQEEIEAAVRQQGIAALDTIEAVVLETDGTFSVIQQNAEGTSSSLRTIERLKVLPEK